MNFENLKELEIERKSLPHSTGGRWKGSVICDMFVFFLNII